MKEKVIKQKVVKWWDWAAFIVGVFTLFFVVIMFLEYQTYGRVFYIELIFGSAIGALLLGVELRKIVLEIKNNKEINKTLRENRSIPKFTWQDRALAIGATVILLIYVPTIITLLTSGNFSKVQIVPLLVTIVSFIVLISKFYRFKSTIKT
ncbi:MAG: hypothetical protein HW405_23 [Candidatus Berkelbacteria bacterium]|nr:hypothetical protein [Candidatus Berkelbacteria bacterium]